LGSGGLRPVSFAGLGRDVRASAAGEQRGAVGFGMPAPGQSYPAVYLAGSVASVWGVYRSDDIGVTWQRIDDPQHQFGWINCLTGDPRLYGRVYLGTGGRGILYGDLATLTQ
jgi:xyloglucan-specific exo-beta-1,4-glucanase